MTYEQKLSFVINAIVIIGLVFRLYIIIIPFILFSALGVCMTIQECRKIEIVVTIISYICLLAALMTNGIIRIALIAFIIYMNLKESIHRYF